MKKQPQPKQKRTRNTSIYVMFGFNKLNLDQTRYLAFTEPDNHQCTYELVEDQALARRFSRNAKKWLDFFNNDPELEDWHFHLIKVKQ